MIWEAAGATIDDPSGLGFVFGLVPERPTKGAWEAVSYEQGHSNSDSDFLSQGPVHRIHGIIWTFPIDHIGVGGLRD